MLSKKKKNSKESNLKTHKRNILSVFLRWILGIKIVSFFSPNNNDDVNKGDNEGENNNLTKKQH